MSIFQNSARSVPTGDDQIVRVAMDEIQIGGRKDHLPATQKADKMTLSHVPNAGSTIGGK